MIFRQIIKPMAINKEWHLKNKMPKNPSMDQRIQWHTEHQEHCSCRKISGKLLQEMKKRGLNTRKKATKIL